MHSRQRDFAGRVLPEPQTRKEIKILHLNLLATKMEEEDNKYTKRSTVRISRRQNQLLQFLLFLLVLGACAMFTSITSWPTSFSSSSLGMIGDGDASSKSGRDDKDGSEGPFDHVGHFVETFSESLKHNFQTDLEAAMERINGLAANNADPLKSSPSPRLSTQINVNVNGDDDTQTKQLLHEAELRIEQVRPTINQSINQSINQTNSVFVTPPPPPN
jgi:hypothetical protein